MTPEDHERVRVTGLGSRRAVEDEYERARHDFRALVDVLSPDDLRRRTAGTRWSNQQMLFHLVLGYLVVRTLLPFCRLMSHLPARLSKAFAVVLDRLVGKFDCVNYWGAVLGARILTPQRLVKILDHATHTLGARLSRAKRRSVGAGHVFPEEVGSLLQ